MCGGKCTSSLGSKVFILADQTAQASLGHPTLTSLTCYLIYLLHCCFMSRLPPALLHKLTNTQAHKTCWWWFMFLCAEWLNKKEENEQGRAESAD